jgi:hypothetical protein
VLRLSQSDQQVLVLFNRWTRLGDQEMQQLNVHEYYELGKMIDQAEKESKADPPSDLYWPFFLARWKLRGILQEPCALLPASQRAARAIIQAIDDVVPEEISDIFKVSKEAAIAPWVVGNITGAISSFETILRNDMPEMSTFSVAQIGIYRTEDLIYRASLQIEEDLRPLLLPLALKDVTEAGKCLAFRVPTAAAFHMSRAIETGMDQYYEALKGKPYKVSPNGGNNNWGAKTKALEDEGADERVTEFLVHIRKAYRNPITHPDVILEPGEAFNFFPQAISVISMMLRAVKSKVEEKQMILPGIDTGFAEQLATLPAELALPASSETA